MAPLLQPRFKIMTRRRMARPVIAPDALQTAVEDVNLTVTTAPAKSTRQDQLIALLRREQGASLTEVAEAMGWLRKKGCQVIRSKVDAVTRYSLAPAAAA